jgi:hypothetical protein
LGQSAPAGREGHRAQPSPLYDRHFAAKEKTMENQSTKASGLYAYRGELRRGEETLRHNRIKRLKDKIEQTNKEFGKIPDDSVLDYTLFGSCDFRFFVHAGKEWDVIVDDEGEDLKFSMNDNISPELGPQRFEPAETMQGNGQTVSMETAKEYWRTVRALRAVRKEKNEFPMRRSTKKYHELFYDMLTRDLTDTMVAYGPSLWNAKIKYDPSISRVNIEKIDLPNGKHRYEITIGKGMYRVLFNENKYRAQFKSKTVVPLEITSECSHGYEGEFLYPKLKDYYTFRGVVKNGRVKQVGEMTKLDLGGRGQDK